MAIARVAAAPTTSYADDRRRPSPKHDVVRGGGVSGPVVASSPDTLAAHAYKVQADIDARSGAAKVAKRSNVVTAPPARLDGHPSNPGGLDPQEFSELRDAQWSRVAKLAAKKGLSYPQIFALGLRFQMDALQLYVTSPDGASAAEIDALGKSYRQRLRGPGGGGVGSGGASGGEAGGATG